MLWFLGAFVLLVDGFVFFLFSGILGCGHYCPISLLFHSSPSPATGGPSDSNNTPPRRAAPLSPGLLDKPHSRRMLVVRAAGESFR